MNFLLKWWTSPICIKKKKKKSQFAEKLQTKNSSGYDLKLLQTQYIKFSGQS